MLLSAISQRTSAHPARLFSRADDGEQSRIAIAERVGDARSAEPRSRGIRHGPRFHAVHGRRVRRRPAARNSAAVRTEATTAVMQMFAEDRFSGFKGAHFDLPSTRRAAAAGPAAAPAALGRGLQSRPATSAQRPHRYSASSASPATASVGNARRDPHVSRHNSCRPIRTRLRRQAFQERAGRRLRPRLLRSGRPGRARSCACAAVALVQRRQ